MNIDFDKVGIPYRNGYEVGRLRTAICFVKRIISQLVMIQTEKLLSKL